MEELWSQSDDCSSLGHQLRPPLSYSGSTNPCLVRTFEFPPSGSFLGLGNSLADLELFVYTLLPWPVTSSAACTYLCLPLAARTLINSGLLVFRLVVPSLNSETLCSAVKSGSTPVGGLVKSGRKRTEDEGRGLDKRLVRPELVTAWIQRLRITSVDPLHRFRSRGVDGDRRRWTRTGVDDYG